MSVPHLNTLKVKDIVRETEDCVTVSFVVPNEQKSDFNYLPGQYLTLEAEISGEKVRRSYSICSAPHEDEWKVAVKKVPSGKFSTFANEVLQVGDEISVMNPMGNFKLECNPTNENDYVSFAAGSGITPMMAMIKEVLKVEPKSTFTLFYGNKNKDSVIFREEIEALKNIYLDRLSVHYILSKERLMSDIYYGRIDDDKCRKYAKVFFDPDSVHSYYLCGPSQMIFAVRDALTDIGVDKDKIHFELFTTDDIKVEKAAEALPEVDRNKMSKVKVTLDGIAFSFDLPYDGDNILDAALAYGADLPFACKGGVCCTCKAKITKGEAAMDINYGLEPDEVEKGYILTCQAHPRTEEIEVNFDA